MIYRKVSPHFWTNGTGRRLRGDQDARMLALYLMTCPAGNMSGLFHLSVPAMGHDLAIPEARIRKALEVLADEDFAHYDENQDLIWVVNALRYQVGEALDKSDKRVPALRREVAQHQGHPFVKALVERADGCYCLPEELTRPKPLRRAFGAPSKPASDPPKAPSEPLPEPPRRPSKAVVQPLTSALMPPEQPVLFFAIDAGEAPSKPESGSEAETEAGSETTQTRALARVIPRPKGSGGVLAGAELSHAGEVVSHYQHFHPRAFPGGLRSTMREAKLLKQRFGEGFSAADICRAIDGYHVSPFHQGLNDRHQKYLDLELIVRDATHVQRGIELADRGPPPAMSEREMRGAYALESFVAKMGGT